MTTTALNAFARDGPPERSNSICTIVARCFGVARDGLTEETSFEELGLDSIDVLALAIDLEEEFDVVIGDHALTRMHTIADVIACIVNVKTLQRVPVPVSSVLPRVAGRRMR